MGETSVREKWITILVERIERGRPLGKPRTRWEDNIKIGVTGFIGHRTGTSGGPSEHDDELWD